MPGGTTYSWVNLVHFPAVKSNGVLDMKGEILILVVAEHIDSRLLPVGVPSDLALKAQFAIRRAPG